MTNVQKSESNSKAVNSPQVPNFFVKLETTELLTLLKRKGL